MTTSPGPQFPLRWTRRGDSFQAPLVMSHGPTNLILILTQKPAEIVIVLLDRKLNSKN